MPVISSIGSDVLVNTATTNFQAGSRIVALSGGRYIVFWSGPALALSPINATNFGTADIRAQIYNNDGTPVGSEFIVNTTTAGAQLFVNATQLSDGNILVTWQDGVGTPFGGGNAVVRAQELSPTGALIGSEFQVAGGVGSAEFPAVSALANGGYVVTWQSGLNGDVRAQIYDNGNATVGSQIIIASGNVHAVAVPTIATLTNGNFVVAWTGPGSAVGYWRVYEASGAPVGEAGLFAVNSFGGRVGNVTALTSGGFVIGYGLGGQSQTQLMGAYFEPDGSYYDSQLIAVEPTTNATSPVFVALPNGGAMAYWQHQNANGDFDINARGYGNSGQPFGNAFTVNSVTAGTQNGATGAARLSDGNLVFAWTDASGTLDGSGTGIVMRRFAIDYTNGAPTAVNDMIWLSLPAGVTAAEIDFASLLANDTDPDADLVTITAVANAVNTGATVDTVNEIISLTPNAGTTGPISFSYTMTDTSLASSTGTVNVGILRGDAFSVRGNTAQPLDILANDLFPSEASGITITAAVNSIITPLALVNGRPQILFNPASTGPDYFNLLVGQTDTVQLSYFVSQNGIPVGSVQGTITRQGWAQLGGAGDDNLTGSAEADHLSGGAGINVLTGLAGGDWYTVTSATTTVVEAINEGFDFVRTNLATYVLPDNIEYLAAFAPTGPITVTSWSGNALNNTISAVSTQGSVTFFGLGGDDQLVGGNNNDVLEGGDGNDVLNGGVGSDTASYASSTFGVTIHLDITGAQNTVQQGLDTLISIENVIGSASHDSLWGDAGNNTLSGGSGFDTLVSGGGINTLIGGADGDTYFVQGVTDTVTELAGGGYDVVLAQTDFSLAAGSEVEALAVNTTNGIMLVGNELQQVLTGNVGNDLLFGGGGNDLLISGAGTNNLSGGSGDDIYYTQGLNDVVLEFGSGGFDVVLAGGNLTLQSNSEVEVIAVNTASGVTIIGSDITQTIQGGSGDDRFVGGLGNDTMTGSGGADTFVLRNTFADRDFITDFVTGSDKIEVSASLFGGGLAAGSLSAAQFLSGAGVTAATTADQRFIYNSSTGNLYFDADGNGAGASVIIANLSNIGGLAASDFVISASAEAPSSAKGVANDVMDVSKAFVADSIAGGGGAANESMGVGNPIIYDDQMLVWGKYTSIDLFI